MTTKKHVGPNTPQRMAMARKKDRGRWVVLASKRFDQIVEKKA